MRDRRKFREDRFKEIKTPFKTIEKDSIDAEDVMTKEELYG